MLNKSFSTKYYNLYIFKIINNTKNITRDKHAINKKKNIKILSIC